MKKNPDSKKSFFLLLVVLGIFTFGAFFFSDNDDMVYEEKDVSEEDTSPTASSAVEEKDFFADYRMRRDRHRDEEIEFYEEILKDESRSEDAKREAESALAEIYRKSSLEDRVEAILIGCNYRDVIFAMEDTLSLLMLRRESLEEEEKVKLVDFVSAYAGVSAESISVFTVD